MIGDALPILLRQANAELSGAFSIKGDFSLRERLRALDIFECMIRIDNVASTEHLSGINSHLDHWALSDPQSLARRLSELPKTLTLAVALTISAGGLGALSNHISLYHWIELARAANGVSSTQAEALRRNHKLEPYLSGGTPDQPQIDLPRVLSFPLPSALRVVQNFRFRKGLMEDSGYREAMRRYVRFFC